MGLHRLYWVPDGFDARHGAYVRYPADELRAVVALEAPGRGRAWSARTWVRSPPRCGRPWPQDGMLRSWVCSSTSTPPDPLPEPPAAVHGLAGAPTTCRASPPSGRAGHRRAGPGGPARARRGRPSRAGRAARRRAVAGALPAHRGRRPGSGARPPVGPRPPCRAAGRCRVPRAPGRRARPDLVLVDLEDLWRERQPQNRPGTGAEAAQLAAPGRPHAGRAAEDQHVARPRPGRGRPAARPPRCDGCPAAHRAGRPAAPDDGARPPTPAGRPLTDDDLFLFNEGTHRRLADEAGRPPGLPGGRRWQFAVWAPNATGGVGGRATSTAGTPTPDAAGPGRPLGHLGGRVAEAPAGPGLQVSRSPPATGAVLEKADPFAFRTASCRPRPARSSGTCDYQWGDAAVDGRRGAAGSGLDAPIVHLRGAPRAAGGGRADDAGPLLELPGAGRPCWSST